MVGTTRSIERCELARADGGVLVLDEATRFDRGVLEAVAMAVQDGELVARDARTQTRRHIQLHVAITMAGCPCEECDAGGGAQSCNNDERRRYLARIPAQLWAAIGVVARTHHRATDGMGGRFPNYVMEIRTRRSINSA